ncbi:choline transporter-like protein 1 [Acyrthosiphon pisum]|uniref:Choline transporter-like protein n=1 Tax=Acyrthosiphon pisum TaxID=7029 RepID=A0A8R1VZP3_ACYPI|nr:choline transporter-like protein 1 [Acyrthosiphon pisum]|eukprot:XP_001944379.2 PREDICTED: choline transporter-like protein 1 [Acyrthosiphon pisum]
MGDLFSCCGSSDRIEPSSPDAKANFKGPVKGRSCTDCSFLVLFLFVLISLFGLVIYCTLNGDVNRLFYGFDECGDICGFKNKNPDPKFCTGKDMTNKPFLKIDAPIYKVADLKYVKRECVERCSDYKDYQEFLHRCIPKGNESAINNILTNSSIGSLFQEMTQDLQHTKWDIIYLCIFAFIVSLVIVFLIRFVAGIVVWFVLIGVVVVSISGSIFLWITWKQKSDSEIKDQVAQRDVNTYFAFALIATISTIVILLIIVAMRSRIALVVQLFKESGKAIQSMPLLLIQPMVTFLFLCLAIVLWSYFAVLIQGSGSPAFEPLSHNVYYKKDQLMKFARVYNILVLVWVIEFIIGCQHMIIAGSVATWFFTRNKDNVSSPISTSIGYLFNYHMGSVALGSFIIAVLQIIRAILNFIDETLKDSQNEVAKSLYKIFQCLFSCIQQFIQYLTRNAYIEIAIYGDNFCRSGQQAFKMITSNVLRVAAINSVGDFVLFLGKVLVVTSTVLLGFKMLETKPGVLHLWVPLTVAGIFAYFVAHCFISVYEMVIDTIFMCFCEDCNLNDGVTQEYYMSKELMDFVESSQKVLRVGDGATN